MAHRLLLLLVCPLLALFHTAHAQSGSGVSPLGSYIPPLAAQTLFAIQLNLSVAGTPLRIAGTTYADGLGTHAVSEILLDVPADAVALSGAVGVDDSALADKKGNPGSVRFRLIAGNSILWESPVLKAGTPAQAFNVPVPSSRYRKIYLQADDAGDNPHNDHADWVNLRWHHGTPEAPQPARIFDGANFGHQPNVPGDQTPAINKALDTLRRAPGSTLRLAPGDYHFHYNAALRRHLHISNHDQPVWHPVGIALADLRDTTLDAQGSRFIFHGRMLPVMFLDSQNVALRNVSLDFARPHLSQATLTKVERGSFEMTVDTRLYPHKIEKGK
ncbi:MAG: NPCBM/NEW2 domain-containing protein, partial [Puniceicoccales bacterium]|nr:NPCBM/NEW2 domain-containing protein [Puniceicoccales bacterium]